MTTKEFIALEKRLLPNLPGFLIKGPLMLISPIEHTLRGFYFEGSSFDKTSFYISSFFLPMCVPTQHLNFSFGDRLRDKGADRWNVGDPAFEARLISAMQEKAQFLNVLQSPQDVIQAINSAVVSKDPHRQQALSYMLIRGGKTVEGTKALDELLGLLDISVLWQQEIALRANILKSKLVDNPEDARSQLLTWELETIHNLGLEGFRTPSHDLAS